MSEMKKIRIPQKATAQQIRQALRIGPISRKAGLLALKKTEKSAKIPKSLSEKSISSLL